MSTKWCRVFSIKPQQTKPGVTSGMARVDKQYIIKSILDKGVAKDGRGYGRTFLFSSFYMIMDRWPRCPSPFSLLVAPDPTLLKMMERICEEYCKAKILVFNVLFCYVRKVTFVLGGGVWMSVLGIVWCCCCCFKLVWYFFSGDGVFLDLFLIYYNVIFAHLIYYSK